MANDNPNIAGFRKQALSCRWLNSPLTASVIEAAVDVLDDSSETGRRILGWNGDPLVDALPLRLAGGLHALARRGDMPTLTALYRGDGDDFTGAVRAAIAEHDAWLSAWLDSPPQTNEVGRSGALMAGLMVAAGRLNMPIQLLELGSSAGLNLNLDRFGYVLGARTAGPSDAAVQIAPNWTGDAPSGVWPVITARAGVDLRPVDVSDDAVAERLIAYCWADQSERVARLEAAIAVARAFPPHVAQGDAADWLDKQLSTPQANGTARIVMHSVFWQYLPQGSRDRITAIMNQAGESATAERPLGWLRFEPGDNLALMALTLRLWPLGDDLHLANCHPHGAHIEWLFERHAQ